MSLLTCPPCVVQGLNAIFMVSLLMHVTRKRIVFVMRTRMFYVQNCWTNFDECFYECYAMRIDSMLVLSECLYVVIKI